MRSVTAVQSRYRRVCTNIHCIWDLTITMRIMLTILMTEGNSSQPIYWRRCAQEALPVGLTWDEGSHDAEGEVEAVGDQVQECQPCWFRRHQTWVGFLTTVNLAWKARYVPKAIYRFISEIGLGKKFLGGTMLRAPLVPITVSHESPLQICIWRL